MPMIGLERSPVSEPAVFSVERGRAAKVLVEGIGPTRFVDSPSLKLALALALYNQGDLSEKGVASILRRYTGLIKNEIEAADRQNPLPTIGFEVETARKIFSQRDVEPYNRFFNAIGMPQNRVVHAALTEDELLSYWEFSPYPSYSAAVQSRILSELIQGGFIPHLNEPYQPDRVREFLDDELISLHVNLGVPAALGAKMPPNYDKRLVEIRGEFAMFSALFALGFTSSQRLQYRTAMPFFEIKNAWPTAKGHSYPWDSWHPSRLEVKALEVSDQRTYRLMTEIQLLGSALFSYFDNDDIHPILKKIWQEARMEISALFDEYGFHPDLLTSDRIAGSNLVMRTRIGEQARMIIGKRARQVGIALRKVEPGAGIEPAA